MKLKKSSLHFDNYVVNRLSFSVVPGFKVKEDDVFDLSPQFNRIIEKLNENEYKVTLDLQLGGDTQPLPFNIDISISGIFITSDVDNPEEYLRINASAILFPYIRSLLTMLSTLAALPPIVMPPINFCAMLSDQESNEKTGTLVEKK